MRNRPARPLLVATIVLAGVLAGGAARATPTARLVYSRTADAESCPDEAAMRDAVASRIGYDAFFPWAKVTVVARFEKRDAAYVAAVDLVDEGGTDHGSRELRTTGTCDELLAPVALAIAIAIDPRALASPTPLPSTPPPAPPPVSPPAPSVPAEPPPPAPIPDAPHAELSETPTPIPTPTSGWELSGGAVVSTGVEPQLTPGFALGGAFRWPAWSLALEGRVDLPASRDASGGGTVSSWLAAGSLVPCAYWGPALGCALVQAGSLQSSGGGVTDARSASSLWLAAGGRVGALLPLAGSFWIRVRADVVLDIVPTSLQLAGAEVWTEPRVAASFGTDVVWRFR